MNLQSPILLLTRPAGQSVRFADAVQTRLGQMCVVVSPILEIVNLPINLTIKPEDMLIFSSQNAVIAFSEFENASGRLAFCVGDRTAEVARTAGFRVVSASGDVVALERLVQKYAPQGRLWYLCGVHTHGELDKKLREAGYSVKKEIVYQQIEQSFTPVAKNALEGGQPVILPLFSQRSAQLVGDAAIGAKASLWGVFISPTVAKAWQGPNFDRAVTAQQPTAVGMLDAVAAIGKPEWSG
ncbi:MAG: uroporphyrinogen-III synthase [Paracoccaceae bacterium]